MNTLIDPATTVPQSELVRLMAQTIGFASPDKQDTYCHRLVLSWDGEELAADATNALYAARASWFAGEESADTAPWGGPDRWLAHVTLGDAKHLKKVFTPQSAGHAHDPVVITSCDDSLMFEARDATTGRPTVRAIVSTIQPVPWDVTVERIIRTSQPADREQDGMLWYANAAVALGVAVKAGPAAVAYTSMICPTRSDGELRDVRYSVARLTGTDGTHPRMVAVCRSPRLRESIPVPATAAEPDF